MQTTKTGVLYCSRPNAASTNIRNKRPAHRYLTDLIILKLNMMSIVGNTYFSNFADYYRILRTDACGEFGRKAGVCRAGGFLRWPKSCKDGY